MLRITKHMLIVAAAMMLLACDKQSIDAPSDQAIPSELALSKTEVEAEVQIDASNELGLSEAEMSAEPPQHVATAPIIELEKWDTTKFKTIQWTDLMPQQDLDALLNPPSYVTEVEDGSPEDEISNTIKRGIAAANDDVYQQALVSTRVVEEMNGQPIRIPGFIVPLEFDDNQTITQFFLVPFFGACIHLPPPPPNQIIFVNYPKGLKLNALYDPFWISGIVRTALVENDTATSSYSLLMLAFEPYTEK